MRYDVVYRIKTDFPRLEIVLNGGVDSLDQVDEMNRRVDGVMVGREVYHNPYLLAEVDARIYGCINPIRSRNEIIELLIPYIREQLAQGERLNSISRHILGLFHGVAGARAWRRYISEHAHRADADENVIINALDLTRR